MSNNLKITIGRLAEDFAKGVLGAIRGASLEEILGSGTGRAAKASSSTPRPAKANGSARRSGPAAAAATTSAPTRATKGRLHRRSEEEISAISDKIVALVKEHPEGLRAEQIRAELGLEAKEIPRPLKDLLAAKKLRTKGQKRATTYFGR